MPDTLRILVFGAHPDDCDIKAGGIAIKYAALEHNVRFISFTNGDAGHHEIGGIQLAQRRRAEAETASAVAGLDLTPSRIVVTSIPRASASGRPLSVTQSRAPSKER